MPLRSGSLGSARAAMTESAAILHRTGSLGTAMSSDFSTKPIPYRGAHGIFNVPDGLIPISDGCGRP
jgi:hypothetical protein